jgi:hypothetical protein
LKKGKTEGTEGGEKTGPVGRKLEYKIEMWKFGKYKI